MVHFRQGYETFTRMPSESMAAMIFLNYDNHGIVLI